MPAFARGIVGSAVFAALAATSSAAAQSTVYVDDDAPVGGDGSSWASAHNSLHTALAGLVSGSEVRVAQGRYAPAGPGGSRHTSFVLPVGVRLIGGFAGPAGADPDARDPAAYVTMLTGDLNSNDGPGFTNTTDNSHHVIVTAGTPGPSTRIDGFLITSGIATGAPLPVGGGLFMNAGSPTIASCTFYRNAADSVSAGGGGAGSFTGSPAFVDCAFIENSSRWPNNIVNGFGGAIFLEHGSLTRCTFTGNIARDGGAVYVNKSITITDCSFTGNDATRGGAVFRSGSGAAIFAVTNSHFGQNSASEGGGIGFFNLGSGVTLTSCTFTGNAASRYGGGVVNLSGGMTASRCIFTGNSATLGGGGIAATGGAGQVINCTIANNTAGQGGGVQLIASNSIVNLRNCILWDNSASSGTGESAQIDRTFVTGTFPTVNYSCVMGLTGALGGTGNVGLDPLFIDPLNGDYSLAFGSPCVDAGDPDPIYADEGGSRNDMGAIGVQNAMPDAIAVCLQLTAIGQTSMVRLDASGSSDPDNATSELTYEWFVDGEPVVCDGSFGSCATIDVPMSFGAHSVTLRVTDPAGALDEDLKTLTVDPASLALLQPTSVSVDFARGEFTFQGEISLPSTVSHTELLPIINAGLSIGGVEAVPAASLDFAIRGHHNDQWRLESAASAGTISRFDIDWGGARFLYRAPGFPIRLQCDTITSTQSVLTMDFNYRRTGAFTMTTSGGVVVNIAANGDVTANVPVDPDCRGKEIAVTLPFPIEASTTFTFSGSVTGTVTAADHLSYSVGRFRAVGDFDPALFPAGVMTMPRTVDFSMLVGAEGYPGVATAASEGITIRRNEWRSR